MDNTQQNSAEVQSFSLEEGSRATPAPSSVDITTLPAPIPDPLLPPCENGVYYTVVAGDTMTAIANRYNISLNSLLAANPGATNFGLRVGQRICVPNPPRPVPTPPIQPIEPSIPINCQTRVRVPANATVVDFMVRYNVSYRAMVQYNPGVDLVNLRAGNILCIPPIGSRGPCPSPLSGYVIPAGYDLQSLALYLRTTMYNLMRLNPNLTPRDFEPGTPINIP